MKPANFPNRKSLRRIRAHAIRAGLYVAPRGFDHGAMSVAAEALALEEAGSAIGWGVPGGTRS